MDETRRSFFKMLAAGAAGVGLVSAPALSKGEEQDRSGVTLFVCGNCDKWEPRENAKIYTNHTGTPTYEEYIAAKKEVEGTLKEGFQQYRSYSDYCLDKRLHSITDRGMREVPTHPCKTARGVAYPGQCPLLKNQWAYSDDPACENFDMRTEGELIKWQKKEKLVD